MNSITTETIMLGLVLRYGHQDEYRTVALKLDKLTWSSHICSMVANRINTRALAGLPFGYESIQEGFTDEARQAISDMAQAANLANSADPKLLFKTLERQSASRMVTSVLANELEAFDLDTSPSTIMATLSRAYAMTHGDRLKAIPLLKSVEKTLQGPLLPMERINNKTKFGITGLDTVIRANAGRLGIVAAHNSAGKSSLTTQAAIMTAKGGGHALLVSCEMGEEEVHARGIACITGVDAWSVMTRQMSDSYYPDWVRVAAAKVHTMHPGSCVEWDQLEAAIRQQDAEFDYDTIIIDYFQLLQPADTASTRRGTDAQAKGEMSKAAKRMAQDLDCSVILVSQFNREAQAGVEPKIDMLRDTGQLENDCDWAILMWEAVGDAPQDNRRVCMRIAKNRGGVKNGMVTSFFNPAVNRFADACT